MDADMQPDDRDAESEADREHEPQRSDTDRSDVRASDSHADHEIADDSETPDNFAAQFPPAEGQPLPIADSTDIRGADDVEVVDMRAADLAIPRGDFDASSIEAEDHGLTDDLAVSHVEAESPTEVSFEQQSLAVEPLETSDDVAIEAQTLGNSPLDRVDATSDDSQTTATFSSESGEFGEPALPAPPRADVDLSSSEIVNSPAWTPDLFQSTVIQPTGETIEPRSSDLDTDSRDWSADAYSDTTGREPSSPFFVAAGPTPPTMPGESAGESQVFRMPPLLLKVQRADWELRIEKIIDEAAKRMDQIAKDRIDAELSYRDHVDAAQKRALYR